MLIYNKVKEICKEKKISVSQVEKISKLGNGSISKWNNSAPNVANLIKVADALGVDISVLTNAEDQPE